MSDSSCIGSLVNTGQLFTLAVKRLFVASLLALPLSINFAFRHASVPRDAFQSRLLIKTLS